jgi:hypothetical protein
MPCYLRLRVQPTCSTTLPNSLNHGCALMSTSHLYRIYRTKATQFAEYHNSHGSAPVVWGHLRERFLGQERFGFYQDDKPLWALARDPRVPLPLRLCHAFTFDLAFCPVEHIAGLADACERVAEITADARYVNHWAAIAADLKTHKAKVRQIGVGLGCTSVCDPWEQWRDEKSFDMWAYVLT